MWCGQLSLLVHPDKCKHPKSKEAFAGTVQEDLRCSHLVIFLSVCCGINVLPCRTVSRRRAVVAVAVLLRWQFAVLYLRCLRLISSEFSSRCCLTNEWHLTARTALAKAQQLLLDASEREYIVAQINLARGTSPFCIILRMSEVRGWGCFIMFLRSGWGWDWSRKCSTDELRSERKKMLKKDNASKIKSMVDEVSKPNDFLLPIMSDSLSH